MTLLENFGGYTRATLGREPAIVVNRWLMALEERGKHIERQSHGG